MRPGITVMYEAGEGVAPAGVDRLLQRIQHTVRAHGGRHPPAHTASRTHVDDERDVDTAAPGCDVREIGDPALNSDGWPRIGGQRGPPGRPPSPAWVVVTQARPRTAPGQAPRAHQARHGAARHRTPSRPQLLPDFPGAVDLLVRVIDPLNLDAALIVALRPCGPARRMCPLVPMAMSPSTGRSAARRRSARPRPRRDGRR